MSRNKNILGLDIADLGRNVFGGVHMAGKVLASAFGFGGAAQSLENLETKGGLLPAWAKSGGGTEAKPETQIAAVVSPDYVVVMRTGFPQPVLLTAPTSVRTVGGSRFDGNGYQQGEPFGKRFSFGVDKPTQVDVTMKDGRKTSFTDAQRVLFMGGTEAQTKISGIERSAFMSTEYDVLGRRVLGELAAAGDEDAAQALTDVIDDQINVIPATGDDYTVGMASMDRRRAYLKGADILGAMARSTPHLPETKPRATAGVVVKRSPATGRTFTSLHLLPTKKTDHAASIKNARDVGNRAIKVGNTIKASLKTAVHGLGAAAAKPGARASTLQIQKAADAAIKAGNDVLKRANTQDTLVKTLVAKKDTGVRAVQAKLNPKGGGQKIKGELLGHLHEALSADLVNQAYDNFTVGHHHDVVGADWMEIVGNDWMEIVGDDPPPIPDPLNPGYMTDGSPDPSYSGGAVPYSPPTGASPATGTAYGGSSTLPGPPDYGAGPPPTGAPPLQANVDYIPDPGYATDVTVYRGDLPLGAVVYDGSQAIPDKGLGSFTKMIPPGRLPGGAGPDFGDGSGFFVDGSGHWHYWGASFYNDGISVDLRTKDPNDQERASLPTLAQSSINHNWGPLVGNPQGGWTKGLRYNIDKDQWFWFYDKAPTWATAADTQARATKAALDYKAMVTAGAADYAQAVAQDKLDAANAATAAKQQAASDASMAHQQAQDLATAQNQAQIQAQQAQAQQAQLDQQWQAAQTQLQQQRAAMLQQRAQEEQQQSAYLQQHPELYAQMLQPAPMDQGGYPSDQGGFGGGYAPTDQGDQGDGVDWGDSSTMDIPDDATQADLEADLPQ